MSPSSGPAPRWRARLSSVLPRTPATIAWLSATALETLVDTVIVGLTLNEYADRLWQTILVKDERSVLPVYLGLFVLAHVTQLVLAVDALIAKNFIQVIALLIFNTLFLAYAAIQIHEIRELLSGYLRVLIWFIPVMISITEATYLLGVYSIYKEFGWSVFKTLGADRRIRKSYAHFQVFLCLLKFDFFFFIAFLLQLVFLVPTQTSAERWITVAALPLALFVLLLGYFSVKLEHRAGFWGFVTGCAVAMGYFIYKLVIVYRDRERDYRLVFKSLTVFAALCLAVLVLTTLSVVICYRNFGRGLKDHMISREHLRSDSTLELKPTPPLGTRAKDEGGFDEVPYDTPYAFETATSDMMPYSGRNRFRMSMD